MTKYTADTNALNYDMETIREMGRQAAKAHHRTFINSITTTKNGGRQNLSNFDKKVCAMIDKADVGETSTDFDPVGRPEHYNSGKIETWDWIELGLSDEEYRGYLKGNIYKYMNRYQLKNLLEDLEKARTYIDRLHSYESGWRTVSMHGLQDDM